MNLFLSRSKIIVVIGPTGSLQKDSDRVASYLQSKGYQLIPVNPYVDTILSKKCYNSILDKQIFLKLYMSVHEIGC